MIETVFRFRYQPDDGAHAISAYDAAQALYGISRSISITTHYAIHGRIIKQAPALKDAKVLVRPPSEGSFEFVVPVVGWTVGTAEMVGALGAGVAGNFLYDLTKYMFRRLTGQSDNPETQKLKDLLTQKPGEIDGLADAIDEDIPRIHRPLDANNIQVFNVYGGKNNFGTFNYQTYDFAKTKIRESVARKFVGNVASLNGNTLTGRFWLDAEERTVGFREDESVTLSRRKRQLFSWSLNEYMNGREGKLVLSGFPLTSRQGTLKMIFITDVNRA